MRVLTAAIDTARATANRRVVNAVCVTSHLPTSPRRPGRAGASGPPLTPPQIHASGSRTLATTTNAPETDKPKRKFPKLDDGLSFDDFVSGEPLPDPADRIVLGNTSQ